MALCRRTTQSEPLESHEADSRDLHRIRCVQQRPETAGIQLRRFHRYLCTHAGGRDGERSPHRLLPISGSRQSLASSLWQSAAVPPKRIECSLITNLRSLFAEGARSYRESVNWRRRSWHPRVDRFYTMVLCPTI